jgi:hypothetical protein
MHPNITLAEPQVEESPAPEAAPVEAVPEEAVPEEAVPEETAPKQTAPEPAVPEPRPTPETDGEAERGKSKKPRRAVRAKSVGGTKALVVWREGRLHYSDDTVLVVDLDEAASPDTDVHDVVDRLTELRDAVESAGRTETVAALAEIIQEKALN